MKELFRTIASIFIWIWLVVLYVLYIPYGLLRSLVCLEWYSEMVECLLGLVAKTRLAFFPKKKKLIARKLEDNGEN